MKYQASLPKHNDNVSHENPLKDFVLILSGLAAVTVLAFWLLGHAVDWAVDNLSPAAEAKLNSVATAKLPASPKDDEKARRAGAGTHQRYASLRWLRGASDCRDAQV